MAYLRRWTAFTASRPSNSDPLPAVLPDVVSTAISRAFDDFMNDRQFSIQQHNATHQSDLRTVADLNPDDPFLVSHIRKARIDMWDSEEVPIELLVEFYAARLVEHHLNNKIDGQELRMEVDADFYHDYPEYASHHYINRNLLRKTSQPASRKKAPCTPKHISRSAAEGVRGSARRALAFLVGRFIEGFGTVRSFLKWIRSVGHWLYNYLIMYLPRLVFRKACSIMLFLMIMTFVFTVVRSVLGDPILDFAFGIPFLGAYLQGLPSFQRSAIEPTFTSSPPAPLIPELSLMANSTYTVLNNFVTIKSLSLDVFTVQEIIACTAADISMSSSIVKASRIPYRDVLVGSLSSLQTHVRELSYRLEDYQRATGSAVFRIKIRLQDMFDITQKISFDETFLQSPQPDSKITRATQHVFAAVAYLSTLWPYHLDIYPCVLVLTALSINAILDYEIACAEMHVPHEGCWFLFANNRDIARRRRNTVNTVFKNYYSFLDHLETSLMSIEVALEPPRQKLSASMELSSVIQDYLSRSKEEVNTEYTETILLQRQRDLIWSERPLATKIRDWWSGTVKEADHIPDLARVNGESTCIR